MGSNFVAHIKLGDHRIPGTSWVWGLDSSGEARSAAPSYGTHVEVPAVVELLELVVAGKVSAAEVRDCLNHIATSINQKMHREYDEMLSFAEKAGEKLTAAQASPPKTSALDSRWVYAVSCEADPKAIKIGVAKDINKRLRSLQIGSASPIVLRWSEQGGFPLERHLHQVFKKRQISSEWFDFRRVADPVKVISRAAKEFLASQG